MKTPNQKTLILHFDINKTIIVSDPVANRDVENILNSIISDKVWGKVEEKDGDKIFVPYDSNLHDEQPEEGLIQFYHYVENLHPTVNLEDKEEQIKANKEIKSKRHQSRLCSSFFFWIKKN